MRVTYGENDWERIGLDDELVISTVSLTDGTT